MHIRCFSDCVYHICLQDTIQLTQSLCPLCPAMLLPLPLRPLLLTPRSGLMVAEAKMFPSLGRVVSRKAIGPRNRGPNSDQLLFPRRDSRGCPGPHSQDLLDPDPINRAGSTEPGQAPGGHQSKVSEIPEYSHRGPQISTSSWCTWVGFGGKWTITLRGSRLDHNCLFQAREPLLAPRIGQ